LTPDFIIIGNGIAGTTLAYEFLKQKKNFLVISDPSLSSSSQVAAGIFNPVVFKRLTLGWKTDELFPFAETYYEEAEKFFGKKFFYPVKMARIFPGIEEQNNWLTKTGSDFAGKYISSENIIEEKYLKNINAPFGYGTVEKSGYIDIATFITAVNTQLEKENKIIYRKINYNEISISDNEVTVSEFKTKKIIFCEGWLVKNNPFFKEVKMMPAKGETVTFKAEGLPENVILHKGCFILPKGNNTFIAGSTFEWNELNEIITEKAKNDLAGKIKDLVKVPFEIIHQQAAVRPAVKDRKPVIGTHPYHPNVSIFNGLGTKGVILAPYFARQLSLYFSQGKPVENEVDVNRFYIS